MKGKPRQYKNARWESVAKSGLWLSSLRKRRCLIPVDGWYEWDKNIDPGEPYFLCREDRELLMLAGIWAERDDGKPGVAIITEPARGLAEEIHHRMPLALDDESIEPWLDPDLSDRDVVRNVTQHIDHRMLTKWRIHKTVNKASDKHGEELLNPA